MAMTASLAANPTTVLSGSGGTGAATNLTLTVSNSAGVAVKVLGLKPYATAGHSVTSRAVAVQLDAPILNAANNTVPASGNTTFSFGASFRNLPHGDDVHVDIGCEVYCGDGTTVYPTVVDITVQDPPHHV